MPTLKAYVRLGCLLTGVVISPLQSRAGDLVLIDNTVGGVNFYLSANGDRAVWYAGPASTCYVWTRGTQPNVQLQGSPLFAQHFVFAISGDGLTATGTTIFNFERPGYWRDFSSPMVPLTLPSSLYDSGHIQAVNTDGNVIVGWVDPTGATEIRAAIWSVAQGTVATLAPLTGGTRCFAMGVSGDGSVVVGDSATLASGNDVHTAFVYRASSSPQVQPLPPLAGDNASSASGLSRNGLWAFGSSNHPLSPGSLAFTGLLWNTQTRSSVVVPGYAQGTTTGTPYAISGDGMVLAARSGSSQGVVTYLWRRENGQRYEINALAAGLGVDTAGWTVSSITSMSDDARTFACVVERATSQGTEQRNAVLRIGCFDGPVIFGQPVSTQLCAMGTVTFAVTAGGSSPLSYAWQWRPSPSADWLNVAAGENRDPHGGPIVFTAVNSSAPSFTVSVSGSTGARWQFRCLVANSCGTVSSNAANMIVNSADFNGDGDIGTDADIQAYFACLAGNCCATCGSADFNADGDIGTDADLEAFFRVLAGGPC